MPKNNSYKNIIAYAQNAEDIVLLRAFRSKRNGFYVDVGAGHPIEGSVSKHLIDDLSWTGVDIEPQPKLAQALKDAHPNSKVIQKAVARKSGTVNFYEVTDNWGASTLVKKYADKYVRSGNAVKELIIQSDPLDKILKDNKVGGIDLLKVDAEGSEAEVFAGIDLIYWRPRVILAEATEPNSARPTHLSWEGSLFSQGYKLCLFDGLNRFYARKDETRLIESLSIPANIFDRYIPYYFWCQLTRVKQLELT